MPSFDDIQLLMAEPPDFLAKSLSALALQYANNEGSNRCSIEDLKQLTTYPGIAPIRLLALKNALRLIEIINQLNEHPRVSSSASATASSEDSLGITLGQDMSDGLFNDSFEKECLGFLAKNYPEEPGVIAVFADDKSTIIDYEAAIDCYNSKGDVREKLQSTLDAYAAGNMIPLYALLEEDPKALIIAITYSEPKSAGVALLNLEDDYVQSRLRQSLPDMPPSDWAKIRKIFNDVTKEAEEAPDFMGTLMPFREFIKHNEGAKTFFTMGNKTGSVKIQANSYLMCIQSLLSNPDSRGRLTDEQVATLESAKVTFAKYAEKVIKREHPLYALINIREILSNNERHLASTVKNTSEQLTRANNPPDELSEPDKLLFQLNATMRLAKKYRKKLPDKEAKADLSRYIIAAERAIDRIKADQLSHHGTAPLPSETSDSPERVFDRISSAFAMKIANRLRSGGDTTTVTLDKIVGSQSDESKSEEDEDASGFSILPDETDDESDDEDNATTASGYSLLPKETSESSVEPSTSTPERNTPTSYFTSALKNLKALARTNKKGADKEVRTTTNPLQVGGIEFGNSEIMARAKAAIAAKKDPGPAHMGGAGGPSSPDKPTTPAIGASTSTKAPAFTTRGGGTNPKSNGTMPTEGVINPVFGKIGGAGGPTPPKAPASANPVQRFGQTGGPGDPMAGFKHPPYRAGGEKQPPKLGRMGGAGGPPPASTTHETVNPAFQAGKGAMKGEPGRMGGGGDPTPAFVQKGGQMAEGRFGLLTLGTNFKGKEREKAIKLIEAFEKVLAHDCSGKSFLAESRFVIEQAVNTIELGYALSHIAKDIRKANQKAKNKDQKALTGDEKALKILSGRVYKPINGNRKSFRTSCTNAFNAINIRSEAAAARNPAAGRNPAFAIRPAAGNASRHSAAPTNRNTGGSLAAAVGRSTGPSPASRPTEAQKSVPGRAGREARRVSMMQSGEHEGAKTRKAGPGWLSRRSTEKVAKKGTTNPLITATGTVKRTPSPTTSVSSSDDNGDGKSKKGVTETINPLHRRR